MVFATGATSPEKCTNVCPQSDTKSRSRSSIEGRIFCENRLCLVLGLEGDLDGDTHDDPSDGNEDK